MHFAKIDGNADTPWPIARSNTIFQKKKEIMTREQFPMVLAWLDNRKDTCQSTKHRRQIVEAKKTTVSTNCAPPAPPSFTTRTAQKRTDGFRDSMRANEASDSMRIND
uniref:Uncharacterized protein n=1 Tax=Caenorhabditis japonica TaxID=281687 RepID=A0A8R1ED39_CAEJA